MLKKSWHTTLLPLVLFGFILVNLSTLMVHAIEEVTPTPATNPASGVDVKQILLDIWADFENEDYEFMLDGTTLVIENEPDNAEAYFFRSTAYRRLGRLSLALDDLTVAIDLIPQTYHPKRAVVFPISQWLAYTIRGDIHVEMGNLEEALVDYDAAIAINPLSDNITAFQGRATVLYRLGDIETGDVDDSIALSLEQIAAGNTSEAIDFLNAAIDSDQVSPSVGIAYYIRGTLFDARGDETAALTDWTRALEVHPQLHIAYLTRGIIHRKNGDMQAAGQDFYKRIRVLGTDFTDQFVTIGDSFQIEMDYRRVVRIHFHGSAGDVIDIEARETGNRDTDPLIALIDPTEQVIAGDDDSGGNLDSLIDDFQLPETGIYTLMVSHAEGGYRDGFEGPIAVRIIMNED